MAQQSQRVAPPKSKRKAEKEMLLIVVCVVLFWILYVQFEVGDAFPENMLYGGSWVLDMHLATGIVVWYFLGLGNGHWMFFGYLIGALTWWFVLKPKVRKGSLDTPCKKRLYMMDVASTVPMGIAFTSVVCVLVCIALSFHPANYEQPIIQIPVLTTDEASRIRSIVNSTTHMQGWTRSHNRAYSTEDIPLSDVPEAYEAVLAIINKRVRPVIFERYGVSHMEVMDLFYVRYSMQLQRKMVEHRDHGCVSLNIAISDMDEYTGGGTYFSNGIHERESSIVRIPQGNALLHGSQIMHAGVRIESGERHIIVAFIKVYGGSEWHHTFGLGTQSLLLEEHDENPYWNGVPRSQDLEV